MKNNICNLQEKTGRNHRKKKKIYQCRKSSKIKSDNITSSSPFETIFVSFAKVKGSRLETSIRKHRYSDYSSSNNEIQEKRSVKTA